MSGSTSGGTQIIREFLVGIKYEETGREALTKNLASVAKEVLKFAAAVEGAAAAAVLAIAKIAAGFEELYFASQRIGSSVESIKALSFALGQVGGTAEGTRSALEGLGRMLRGNPGAENFLQSLGISTRSNGKLRETTDMLQELGQTWRRMSDAGQFPQAQAQASVLGIDERTMLALMQDTRQFSAELKEMYRSAGLDSDKAAAASHGFMNSLRLLIEAFGVLKARVITDVAGKVGEVMERFRKAMVSHFKEISKAISTVTEYLLIAAEVLLKLSLVGVQMLGDLVGWFNHLDGAAKGVIIAFAGIAAALMILASPVTAIAALVAVIGLLYDDYKHWQEYGSAHSLIDWGVWEPSIKAVKEAVTWLIDTLKGPLTKAFQQFETETGPALAAFFRDNLPKAIDAVKKAILDLSKSIGLVMREIWALAHGDLHGALDAARELNELIFGGSGSPRINPALHNSGLDPAPGETPGAFGPGGANAPAAPATGGAGGISRDTGSGGDKAAFIAKWRPEAERIAARAGTTADILLAHWGQETGWGAHEHDNNPGNLQALGPGPGVVQRGDTHADGTPYTGNFQAYADPHEGADGVASWMERHGAVGPGASDTPEAYGRRLLHSHYMENPNAPADIARATRTLQGAPRPGALPARPVRPDGPPAPGTINPTPPPSTPAPGPQAWNNSTTNNSPAFNQTVHVNIASNDADVAGQVDRGLRSANQAALRHLSSAVT